MEDNFELKTHSFKFAKHVSEDQHQSSLANKNEPLVGVIWKGTYIEYINMYSEHVPFVAKYMKTPNAESLNTYRITHLLQISRLIYTIGILRDEYK